MRPGGRGAPRSRPRGRGGLRGSSASADSTNTASRGARTVHFSSPRSASIAPSRGSNSVLRQALRGAVQSKSEQQAQPATDRTTQQPTSSQGSFQERYQQLKKSREKERTRAIATGFLADPDRPRTLAEAITPVGTCPDMCAEFERVERVVQNDVWGPEIDLDNPSNVPGASKQLPDERRMVKKFRRAAAGTDEQLPSDLRPPLVLQKTIDYLFNSLLAQAESLAGVHHFIWDRTRAIRNDFSIQQVSKADDVKIAIDCYERIARFHIVSLHQLALPEKPYEKYDSQQEREQLDKTLLSLMQLYDDNRKNLKSANEAEFRAFCIIFQIQDPVPDLEDRVQTWPEEVLNDGRIKRALAIYAAACNTSDAQGPLKPRATHPIARANWRRFWQIVQSSEISYCMACVAEIYFPLIRRITLNAIWRSFRAGGSAKSEDWSLSELVDVFGMDNQQDAAQFCKEHGFVFSMRQDGAAFLDLTSVTGKHLPEPTRRIGQLKSLVVERKRYNRALSAVINGMTVRAAEEAGLIEQPQANEDQDMSEEDSLFVPENSTTKSSFEAQTPVVNTVIDNSKLNPFASAFSPSCAVSSLQSGSQSDTSAAVSTSQPEGHKKAIAISNDDTPDTAKASGSLLGAYNSGERSRTMMQSSSPFGFGQIHPASTSTAAFGAPSTTLNNVASLYQPEHPASNTKELDSAPAQSSPFNFNTNKPYFSNTPNSSPFTFGSSFSASGIHSNLQKTNPFTSTTATSPANLPTDSTPASSIPPVPYSPGGFTFPSSISRAPAISSFPPATSSLPKSPNSDPSRFPDFSIPSVAVQASTSPFSYTPTTQLAPSSAVNHTLAASATHTSQTHVGTTHDPEHDIASAGAVSGPSTSLPSARNEASVPVSGVGRSSLNANNSTTPQRVAVTKMQRSRILRDLSQKLLLDPGGYLEQYVEYFTNPIITRIQEDIAAQRLCEEADEHRVSRLSFRYGTRWRDITWNRRVLRKGKERRARLARDVLKKSTNTIAPGEDEVTTFVSSLNRRVRPSVRRGRDERYAEEDNDVESLRNGNGDSRDEASPRGKDTRATERARQAELQSSRRSSIASETSRYSMNVLPSATRHDTTRSTYFKMKALGLDPNAGQPAKPLAQSMKRIRSNDDFDAVVDKRRFSPSPSSPPPLRSSKELSGPSLHRTPSDEDAELFAAIRAARDAMSESISFFKEEMAKDELNRSRSSEGLNDSIRTANPPPPPRFDHSTASTPTLSMGSATLGKEPPPKYRNRVSKFLPRELYADVLLERQRRANVNANGVANGVAIKPTAAARTSIRERMGIGTARTPLRRQASPPPKTTAPPAVQPNVHAPVGAQRRANPFAALSEGGTAAHDEDDEDAGADGGGERVEHDEAAHPKFEDHSDDNAADFAGDEALNGREGPDDMGEWDEEDGEEGCEEEGVGEPSEDEYSDDDEGEYDDNDDDDSQAGYTDEEYPASTAAVVAAPPSRLVDGKSGASVDDAIEL